MAAYIPHKRSDHQRHRPPRGTRRGSGGLARLRIVSLRSSPSARAGRPVPMSATLVLHGQRKRTGTGGGPLMVARCSTSGKERSFQATGCFEEMRCGTCMAHDGSSIISQGDMGAGVFGWSRAPCRKRASSAWCPQQSMDVILARLLQLGDVGGSARSALNRFQSPVSRRESWNNIFDTFVSPLPILRRPSQSPCPRRRACSVADRRPGLVGIEGRERPGRLIRP